VQVAKGSAENSVINKQARSSGAGEVGPEGQSVAARRRRLPSQQRGMWTLDVILEAACQLFEVHGYQNVTTNQIAERSGVSIGSIYQYFVDKDSIAEALVERASRQLKTEIDNCLRANPSATMEEDTYKSLKVCLSFYEKNRFVLLELVDQNPNLHHLLDLLRPEQIIFVTLKNFREKHADRFSARRRYIDGSFVESHTMFNAIRAYVREMPQDMAQEAFLNSLANLCILYETNPHVDYAAQFGASAKS
jgi:AcrR family transcriptional regulator